MTGMQRHPLVALARYPFRLFSMLVFDPRQTLLNLRGMPAYACNLVLYRRRNRDPRLRIRWDDLYPVPREHVGLGRYGEELNPRGHLDAARELARVLAPGGELLVGVPIGRGRLCFDAHRVLDPQTVVDAFAGLKLSEFSLVDDRGSEVQTNASFDLARRCSYGCGLFAFRNPVAVRV